VSNRGQEQQSHGGPWRRSGCGQHTSHSGRTRRGRRERFIASRGSELAANAAPSEAAPRRRVSALVTSAASLKRRAWLSPEASERAERRAWIVALARQALGDDDEARGWLNDPHPLLGAARHDRCWRDRPLCATGGEDPAQHREGSAGLTQLVEWARPSAATNVGCT
jgi:hypothetical protein